MSTKEQHNHDFTENTNYDSRIQLLWKNLSITRENHTYINNSSGFITTGKVYAFYGIQHERYNLLLNCLANVIPKGYHVEGEVKFNTELATKRYYKTLVTISENEELLYSKAKIIRYLECLAERKQQVDSKKYVNDLLLEYDITFNSDKTFENIEQDELISFFIIVAVINETPFLFITKEFTSCSCISWESLQKVFKQLKIFTEKGNCVLIYYKDLFSSIVTDVDEVILFKRVGNFHCKVEDLLEFFPKMHNEKVQQNLNDSNIYELIKNNATKYKFELYKAPINLNTRFIKSYSPFLSLISELESSTKTYYAFLVLLFSTLIIIFYMKDPSINDVEFFTFLFNYILLPSVIDVYKYLEITKKELSNEYFTASQYFMGLIKYNWVAHILLTSSTIIMFLVMEGGNYGLNSVRYHFVFYTCLLELDLLLVFILSKKSIFWYIVRKILLSILITGIFLILGSINKIYFEICFNLILGILDYSIFKFKLKQSRKSND